MDHELQRAADRLAKDPRVLAVFAFGSRARGESGPRSDVDLAVLLTSDEPLSLREELRLRAEVVEELRRDDIDLVILNLAPPLLAYEVVAAGCRLFSRDEEASDDFEARAAMRCFDTEWLRRVQQQYAREAWS
jgi:predicted nucleotidyltransferase